MKIVVSNIQTSLDATKEDVFTKACNMAGLPYSVEKEIYKKSVDARKGTLSFVWSVCIHVEAGQKISRAENIRILPDDSVHYKTGDRSPEHPPVVVGFGPAGMLCALTLAEHGYCPVVLERGGSIEERDIAVSEFNTKHILNENCNIQFGEGGAGTYSDGKLNTGVNNPLCREVLRTFVRFGADPKILYEAKPHVGTDKLKNIVKAIRLWIIQCGGKIYFNTRVTGFLINGGRLAGVQTDNGEIPAEECVLAVGHSARDMFFTLNRLGLSMERKLFSMGFRIEHLQARIDEAMYGRYTGHPALGAADYKVWDKSGKRGVYSFCMCPGGQVVAAASESGGVVTNGMSNSLRNGKNANSALAVEVLPEDFDGSDPLAGIRLQQKTERLCFENGGGDYTAPASLLSFFMNKNGQNEPCSVLPTYPLGVRFGSVEEYLLPGGVADMQNAIRGFSKKIKGFDDGDAVLTAPETRTSSPVRILRREDLYSPDLTGLIPCGEGAGYAGGITSAGADGLRCALRIMAEYKPLDGGLK